MSAARPQQTIALRLLLAAVSLLFCAAPVPGDVGGCGQEPADLDPGIFFASKQAIDCERCNDCQLLTQACTRACDPKTPVPRSFPQGCFPLVHDGEVCLRALRAASCDDYAGFVDDRAPTVPSECNFCPLEAGK